MGVEVADTAADGSVDTDGLCAGAGASGRARILIGGVLLPLCTPSLSFLAARFSPLVFFGLGCFGGADALAEAAAACVLGDVWSEAPAFSAAFLCCFWRAFSLLFLVFSLRAARWSSSGVCFGFSAGLDASKLASKSGFVGSACSVSKNDLKSGSAVC